LLLIFSDASDTKAWAALVLTAVSAAWLVSSSV